MGWISKQISNTTGSVFIRVLSYKRFCSNKRLHGSVMQRHSNSKFSNTTRRSPHATTFFSRRVQQFGQLQQIHEWILRSNQRRMASTRHPPIWRIFFFDTHSVCLLESSQVMNFTQIRIKFTREADSHENPFRIREQNLTKSWLPLALQKENFHSQIKGRGRVSFQNTRNCRFSKEFHWKKTTARRFPTTIARSSWPYSQNLEIVKTSLQRK